MNTFAQIGEARSGLVEESVRSGIVTAQPYLAPSVSRRWHDESALGDPITIDLSSARVALAGVAELTPAQVAGLNQGRLC